MNRHTLWTTTLIVSFALACSEPATNNGGAAGGADLLRLARAVMAAAEGRPPPTIASFVDVDDDKDFPEVVRM